MATTQIDGGRQIKSGSVTGTQLASSTVADSNLATSYIKADGSRAFTADANLGSHKLTNVATPASGTDAATKDYVDSAVQGFDWKASVRVATTAAGTLASSFANGSTVDGVTLATGDRILLKNQASGSENGIYTVNASGAPTRATDADASAEVTAGMATFVSEGTTNADSQWVLTTNDPITLGTTALAFSQVGGGTGVTAGAGLTLTGSTVDVVAADTSLTVNADSMQVHLGDASLEVSSGLRVVHGTGGQVYIANSSGVLTPATLSGDVSSVSNTGSVSLASSVMKSTNYITREPPSGALNGSNATFTLANTPVAGSEMVFVNGQLMEPGSGNDYTISGATITILSGIGPLVSTDRLRVSYIK